MLTKDSARPSLPALLFDLLLIALIALGVVWRFSWVNWNENADLHPDEYGLTGSITGLALPESLADYFNTRISPISPYQKYDETGTPTVSGVDNRMRWGQWPIILIRAAAEATGNTGYTELRLMGRSISALADTLSLLLIFLIGRRLYSTRAGLLAAALSALAVMQIQQSHFMTSDNFATLFTALGLFAAAGIAFPRQAGDVQQKSPETLDQGWRWYALFGVALGMAVASKINLAPLAGMAVVAAGIRLAYHFNPFADLHRALKLALPPLLLAALVAVLTFRVTQPMSFRAPAGDTTFLTTALNPDWVESMKVAQNESSGVNAGPPGEQWTDRPTLVFPWVNMVVWGMGPLLGLTAWAAFGWALWQALKAKPGWLRHLLPLVWVGGYFLFMGTRHVMSMRYFLPIYPFLALFAAWGLLVLWQRVREGQKPIVLPTVLTALVLAGTLTWAWSFTGAVYRQPNTRVEASRWIFRNLPAPFNLQIDTGGGVVNEPLSAPDGLLITGAQPYVVPFTSSVSGQIQSFSLAYARSILPEPAALYVRITTDPGADNALAEAVVSVMPDEQDPRGKPVSVSFEPVPYEKDRTYYLVVTAVGESLVEVHRTITANEDWDESLPSRIDGYDPFGQFYTGLTNGVRWVDDENKRQMLLSNLERADYLILPSQRSIWSISRLPERYPMTMEYYRALFDGRLGFELAANIHHPWRIGPLYISDIGGQVRWGERPVLPLFNNNLFAAEEAFSVYDHAPVWIFKKSADFDIQQVKDVLNNVDLSAVR
jgi:hypothetical protein